MRLHVKPSQLIVDLVLYQVLDSLACFRGTCPQQRRVLTLW